MMKIKLHKILSLGALLWCVALSMLMAADDGGESAKQVTEEGLNWVCFPRSLSHSDLASADWGVCPSSSF